MLDYFCIYVPNRFFYMILLLLMPACKEQVKVAEISPASEVRSISFTARCGFFETTRFSYEKPDKVHVSTSRFGRVEAEIYCDGEEFWFWMRSFDPDNVYRCRPADISKTRLKPPLHPELIKGVAFIDPPGTEGLYSRRVSVEGGNVTRQTFSDDSGPVLKLKAESFRQVSGFLLPEKVRAEWPQEGMTLEFKIADWKVNEGFPITKKPDGLGEISLEGY